MKNYIQKGSAITVAAPANVQSGEGVMLEDMFGIAGTDADSGDDVALHVVGVYSLPKASVEIDAGENVFWDDGDVTNVATGNRLIGVAAAPAATADSAVEVRLNGTSVPEAGD